MGVAIVTDSSNYGNPIGRDVQGPWQQFDHLLAEPFIRGRELTVAVLGDRALCVTELQPKSGFYDFEAKYTEGKTEHICPAQIPDDVTEAMLGWALQAHRVLGCRGASRSDFRWDDTQGVDPDELEVVRHHAGRVVRRADAAGAHAVIAPKDKSATLNATATCLIVAGLVFIKRGQKRAHITCMASALVVSAVFLLMVIQEQRVLHIKVEIQRMKVAAVVAVTSAVAVAEITRAAAAVQAT